MTKRQMPKNCLKKTVRMYLARVRARVTPLIISLPRLRLSVKPQLSKGDNQGSRRGLGVRVMVKGEG